MSRIPTATVAFAVCTALLAGCTSNVQAPPADADAEMSFADEYRIGIGDNLQIHVYRNPDLSVGVPVRPDGKITVPIAGDVAVGGLTPEEVSKVIAGALSEYVRDPIVTTSVTGLGSGEYLRRVRVTGAVGSPSTLDFRNGMTVLDVILQAGGVTDFANPSKTVIYRNGGERLRVRLDRILKRGDLGTNYRLRPGDIITVPESIF